MIPVDPGEGGVPRKPGISQIGTLTFNLELKKF